MLYAREEALLAQAFDADSLTVTGEPFRVSDQVKVHPLEGEFFSAADNGMLVYDPSSAPQWRGDGKEIFYLSGDRKLMAVEVSNGGAFKAGIPQALFDLSAAGILSGMRYAAAADGRRFIFLIAIEGTAPSSLAVVVNWTAGLKK